MFVAYEGVAAVMCGLVVSRGDEGRMPTSPGDPDASWGRRTFGYKGHLAIDHGSWLIRNALATPASVNDTLMCDAARHPDEEVLAAGVRDGRRTRRLEEMGIANAVMHRANKHHPVLPAEKRSFEAADEGVFVPQACWATARFAWPKARRSCCSRARSTTSSAPSLTPRRGRRPASDARARPQGRTPETADRPGIEQIRAESGTPWKSPTGSSLAHVPPSGRGGMFVAYEGVVAVMGVGGLVGRAQV